MTLCINLCVCLVILLAHEIAGRQCGIHIPTFNVDPENAATVFLSRSDVLPTFPWNVVIVDAGYYIDSVSCLGTLIPSRMSNASDIILTTASCFWSKFCRSYIAADFYKVLAGFSSSSDTRYGTVTALAEKITIVPSTGNDQVFRHDFAILKTKQPLLYSHRVSPVCLPTADDNWSIDERCFVSQIEHSSFRTRWKVEKAMVRLLPPEKCTHLLKDAYSSDINYCSVGLERHASERLGASLVCLKSFGWVMYGVHKTTSRYRKISKQYAVDLFTQLPPVLPSLAKLDLFDDASERWHAQSDASDGVTNEPESPDGCISNEGKNFSNCASAKVLEIPTETSSIAAESNNADSTSTMVSLEESEKISISDSEISLSTIFQPNSSVYDGTTINNAPWSAVIMDKEYIVPKVVCSGSLLKTASSNHSDVILTAATCVYTGLAFRYAVAAVKSTIELNRRYGRMPSSEREIATIHFKPFMGVQDNCVLAVGVAILKLKRPYVFKPNRLPISIGDEKAGTDVLEDCYMTGTNKRGDIIQARVRVLSAAKCKQILGHQFYERNELCAVGRRGFPEVNTGSPLVCRKGNGWYQYGVYMVTSTKGWLEKVFSKEEAKNSQVSIYFKLSSFRDFIDKTISRTSV